MSVVVFWVVLSFIKGTFGEDVTTVINSYTKLSDTDKETVKLLIKSLPM